MSVSFFLNNHLKIWNKQLKKYFVNYYNIIKYFYIMLYTYEQSTISERGGD